MSTCANMANASAGGSLYYNTSTL